MSARSVEIVFPRPLYDELVQGLAFGTTADETAGVILASPIYLADGNERLLARELLFPRQADYLTRADYQAQVAPQFVANAVKRARGEGSSIIFFHSHPFDSRAPHFSVVDDEGERQLLPMLARRLPERSHGALVISPGGMAARVIGSDRVARVTIVGADRRRVTSETPPEYDSLRFDRQVRAFGPDGQRMLGELRVGIVGLGGTGSIVADALAHLGVKRFVLVDMDTIEPSNLNRLVGPTASDVGELKTMVAARQLRSLQPDAQIEVFPDSIVLTDIARRLADVDFLFSCTDTHGSRAVLNQLAYQYIVPCIDLGVGVEAAGGMVQRISGRVQMLAPGLGCLVCGRVLDPELVRRDLLTDAARAADPYITGEHVPQPAVMSLNGTVASLAVTMFLAATVGIPSTARLQVYNGLTGTVRAAFAAPEKECFVCGVEGAIGRGDSWPLFGRRRT